MRSAGLDEAQAGRDSQESSPTPQFKSINFLALSFLHSPTFTSMEYYSATKNDIMLFARMDLEIITLSEVSKKEDKYHMISLLFGI